MHLSEIQSKNFLIKSNHISSYLPGISSVTNLVDLLQKCFILPCMSKTKIKASPYYTYLEQKSFIRCVILTILPGIGNAIMKIHDSVTTKWDDRNYMREAVKKNPTALQYASQKLRRNEFREERKLLGPLL